MKRFRVGVRGAGVIALGLMAVIAVPGVGRVDKAEARINGDPASGFAQICKNIQNAYDNAVDAYYEAETPEQLIAARERLNHWSSVWKEYGCDGPYGDIRFLKIEPSKTFTGAGIDGLQVDPGPSGAGKVTDGTHRLTSARD
jgi:hypothetical protein